MIRFGYSGIGGYIDFNDYNTRLIDGNLHTHSWTYDSSKEQYGERVGRFSKDSLFYELKILFTEHARAELNKFHDITEACVINNVPGTLYWDDWELDCFIIEQSTRPSDDYFGAERTFKVFAPYPFWIRKNKKEFLKNEETSTQGLDYNYDYNYDYAKTKKGSEKWQRKHIAPSHFRFEIYGTAVNPSIRINGHTYAVESKAEQGEYIAIDSREQIVEKRDINGRGTNLFDKRVGDIFRKIEADDLEVDWSGAFGFTLTIYEERSEPTW